MSGEIPVSAHLLPRGFLYHSPISAEKPRKRILRDIVRRALEGSAAALVAALMGTNMVAVSMVRLFAGSPGHSLSIPGPFMGTPGSGKRDPQMAQLLVSYSSPVCVVVSQLVAASVVLSCRLGV